MNISNKKILYTFLSAVLATSVVVYFVIRSKKQADVKKEKQEGDTEVMGTDNGNYLFNGIAGTEHFNISEFNSHDGVNVPREYMGNTQKLMEQLEVIRAALGDAPIHINDSYRSPAHNAAVGGKSGSMHLVGKAADITCAGFTPSQVKDTIESLIAEGKIMEGGVGLYDDFVHYDIRGTKARWFGKHYNQIMANSYIGRQDLPLGLKNNNVGNIRPISGTDIWQGQIGVNKGFAVFENLAWGIRAFATNMYSSITKHNTDTLEKYINRYAPSSENDTSNYVNRVASATGIGASDKIPTDQASVKKILRAQMVVELGKSNADLVSDSDIDEGFSLLSSPIASFFSATAVYAKANPKKSIGIVAGIGLVIYGAIIYIKRKSI